MPLVMPGRDGVAMDVQTQPKGQAMNMDLWTDNNGQYIPCVNRWLDDNGIEDLCEEYASRGVFAATELLPMCEWCGRTYDETAPVIFAELCSRRIGDDRRWKVIGEDPVPSAYGCRRRHCG